jgi:hypothetical protein
MNYGGIDSEALHSKLKESNILTQTITKTLVPTVLLLWQPLTFTQQLFISAASINSSLKKTILLFTLITLTSPAAMDHLFSMDVS